MNFVFFSVSYSSRPHLHIKYLCRNQVVVPQPQGPTSSESKNQPRTAQTGIKRGCLLFVELQGTPTASRSEQPPHQQPSDWLVTTSCRLGPPGEQPLAVSCQLRKVKEHGAGLGEGTDGELMKSCDGAFKRFHSELTEAESSRAAANVSFVSASAGS